MEDFGQTINRFSGLRILVVGDYMLDQYIWGKVERISPEAPVPVVRMERETTALGGAGNVVANLRSLEAEVIVAGIVGDDSAGQRIRTLLSECRADCRLLVAPGRPTTVKTRIIAHQQQVVRVDMEDRTVINSGLQSQIARDVVDHLDSVDAVIISDYNKGVIAPTLLEAILPVARKKKKLVCVDPKPRYFSSYSPVTILTPNLTEAGAILGYALVSDEDVKAAGQRILQMIQCDALLITRGEKGMALFTGGSMKLFPARAREVFDVTGAGDTVISALCLALAAGAEISAAVEITTLAAGIVVGKLGAASVTPQELMQAFGSS